MRAYCPRCKTERKVKREHRKETYPVKGEPVTIDANVLICSMCGTDIFNEALDSENLALAYSKYRKAKGIVDVDEITKIRKKYGLSQRGIAALLGWSPATISRYEAGAIPSIPHNEQLCRFDEDAPFLTRNAKPPQDLALLPCLPGRCRRRAQQPQQRQKE